MENDKTPLNFLLIRGLIREARHWGEFPESLIKRLPNARVHTLDLPGVGKRFREKAPKKIAHYTEDLRRQWKALQKNNDGDWVVISISMGSMIALDWAAKYPKDFRSFILINSSAKNFSSPLERMQWDVLKRIPHFFLSNDLQKRERDILKLTLELREIDDKLTQFWVQIQQDSPVSRLTFLRQIYAASQFRAPQGLTPPLLFLAAQKDKLAHYKCSQKLAKHYNATLHLHQEAGHDLPLDDTPWVVNKVYDFLKEG